MCTNNKVNSTCLMHTTEYFVFVLLLVRFLWFVFVGWDGDAVLDVPVPEREGEKPASAVDYEVVPNSTF